MLKSAADKRRQVLFISYLFPPTGGGGVQRSVKFAKYLPTAGWDPIVLTVKPISYYVYDPSLLQELPPNVLIERTGSLDPLRLSAIALGDRKHQESQSRVVHPLYTSGSLAVRIYRRLRSLLLFPDAQVGWIPFAYVKGLRLIRRYRPAAIYATIAPFSSGIVAHMLARTTGLPYVIDLRDGWTDDEYHSMPSRAHVAGHARLEKMVLTGASGVSVYGAYLAERLTKRYPSLRNRIQEINNGYDPADIQDVEPAPRATGTFRVVYSGSLFPHHRDVYRTFLRGVASLPASVRRTLEIVIVGNAYPSAQADTESLGLAETVRFLGYVPHGDALSYLASADASLLLVRSGDVASVTGKVFEMFMVNRPIIALAEPDGEAARILRLGGAGEWIVRPDDSRGVASAITGLLDTPQIPRSEEVHRRFSRIEQSKTLAGLLGNSLIGESKS